MSKPISTHFEASFYKWLDKALSISIPSQVVGFSFNLVELHHAPKFGIELVGTSTFSKEDEDWACDDVFTAEPRTLKIPKSYSGKTWQECLQKMSALSSKYLNSGSDGANTLNSAIGVGIGFVDGNLHLLKS